MTKRLIREIRQAAMILLLIGCVIFTIWLFSCMSGVLGWLRENWLPVAIGFATALVTKGAISVALGDSKDRQDDDDYDYEEEEEFEEEEPQRKPTRIK